MFPAPTPVIKNLLIINVIVFILIVSTSMSGLDLGNYLPLHNPTLENTDFKPFQLVTYMFTHFSIGHIFFNMLVLYFFGPMVENRIGGQRTFIAYIMGGLISGVIYLVYNSYIEGSNFALLGASGAVYTITILAALHFSSTRVQLIFPPIAMPLGMMAALYISVDILFFSNGSSTGIAHLAHLAGAAMGFLLYYLWKK